MAFRALLCTATDKPWRGTWCHCASALRNLNFGADPLLGIDRLVRPGLDAPEREIVGIGGLAAGRLLRLDELVGNTLALAIGHGLFLGMKVLRQLLLHVAGAG